MWKISCPKAELQTYSWERRHPGGCADEQKLRCEPFIRRILVRIELGQTQMFAMAIHEAQVAPAGVTGGRSGVFIIVEIGAGSRQL
jgi:hypothetical protein